MSVINGRYYANPQYGRALERARAANAESRRVHGEEQPSWLDHFLGLVGPPSPPLPPHPTPPRAAPEAYDDAKVNVLRVRQIANIVANENRDVKPGKSSPQELQRAKIAQAHAIINADRKYGTQRDDVVGTAPKTVTGALASSEQYKQSLDAARTAFQQQLAGQDPIGGRMWFNHRNNADTGARHLGHEQVGVFEQFGPFQLGKHTRYTIIDENPKYMPKPKGKKCLSQNRSCF
jgi:hypothetical protein